MGWSFDNGLPIYQQIIRVLRERIANGMYPPGSRIPAVRELAMEAGVNPNTMQRALSELERDALLVSQRTSGRFVTQDLESLSKLREDLAAGYVKELCERLIRLGLDRRDIQDAVRRELDG